MPIKSANAVWNGSLVDGNGHMTTKSGAVNVDYSWQARSGDAPGTNPEELIAAAHAGCFSMALSHMLAEAGHPPTKINTTAEVSFDKVEGGFAITKILLKTEGQVPGIDEAAFKKHADNAKTGCPVSKALASVPMTLEAKFVK
ncbi:MAG TPA: OsmC family protein [Tepidisphaeraceae bacterium]|jgi:osmotically inducible protein OsmC|nr:OsmC family protein [Tepidisphaeraceae bacterium]